MIRQKATLKLSCGHDSPAAPGPAAYPTLKPLSSHNARQSQHTTTTEEADDIEKIDR